MAGKGVVAQVSDAVGRAAASAAAAVANAALGKGGAAVVTELGGGDPSMGRGAEQDPGKDEEDK
jgi:hypothetical protein